jgi:membrane fusion protein, heavy metal efflux system
MAHGGQAFLELRSLRGEVMISKLTIRPVRNWFVACLVILSALRIEAYAHEGHAPLPTKGAQVDVEKGTVTLSAEARKSLGVETAEVTLQPIEQTVLAYATVSLDWEQHRFVTTPISGRIARLYIKPGETVVRGQKLAEIESTELTRLQLQLLDSLNRFELSNNTLSRVETLVREQVVAGRELTEAKAAESESKAAVGIAKSKLKRLRLTDDQIETVIRTKQPIPSLAIESPLTGVAIHTDLALGKFVEPTEHLFEVMDLSTASVRIDVAELDLAKVKTGQPAKFSVAAFPEVVFEGAVTTKEPYIDPETHLGRVWVKLPNAPNSKQKLLPGMYGQAEIIVSPAEKLVTVPKKALLTNGTEWFVLVEDSATARASEYRKKNVAIGISDSNFAAFSSGDVFPGDQVVTTGGHEMSNFFIQGVLRLSPEARKNLGVSVEPVRAQHVDDVFEVDGTIDLPPEQQAVAASQLAGTIENILVERGQSVRAGQVVAEISSLEFLETQYELTQAHVALGRIEELLGNLRQFKDGRLVAKKRLLELESEYEASVFQRDSARQRLMTLGLSKEELDRILAEEQVVDLLPVRAPIDGVIVRFEKMLGEVVQADQPLFEIHDLSRIVVRALLGERDIAKATVGTTARVRVVADPAFVGEGKVVRVGSTFGEENRTASAWVEVSEAPARTLYHGMLARVTFAVRNGEPILALPKEAFFEDGTRSFVFVQDASGLLTRRPVKNGREDDRLVEVTSGLKVGELVAVEGAGKLQTAYASLR